MADFDLSSLLGDLSPEEYAQIQAQLLGGSPPVADNSRVLEMQMRQAMEMRQPQQQRHVSPLGTVFGGLGNIVGGVAGGLKQSALGGQLQENNAAVAKAGQQRAQGAQLLELLGKKQQQKFQLGRDEAERKAQEARDLAAREHAEKMQGRQFGLEREKMGAAEQAAKLKSEADKSGSALKSTSDLRKEFQALPEVKAFKDVSTAVDKIRRAGKDQSAVADMAMVYSLITTLDPGSAVKEGEYASAKNTTGVPGIILNYFNQAKDGRFLNAQQRAELARVSENLLGAHRAQVTPIAEKYKGLASKFGADPMDVVLDDFADGATASKPTAGGDFSLEGGGLPPEKQKRKEELKKLLGLEAP